MDNQQILDYAPEGATHIDNEYDYWVMSKSTQAQFFDYEWNYCEPQEPLRCLIDIKRIAELEEEELNEDEKSFILDLLEPYLLPVPANLNPTFYHTLSYNGDLLFKRKAELISKKLNTKEQDK